MQRENILPSTRRDSISSFDLNIIKLVRAHIACDKGLVGLSEEEDTIYMTRENAIQVEQKKKAEQARRVALKQKRAEEAAETRGCVIS